MKIEKKKVMTVMDSVILGKIPQDDAVAELYRLWVEENNNYAPSAAELLKYYPPMEAFKRFANWKPEKQEKKK